MDVFIAKNAVLRFARSRPHVRLEQHGELAGEPSVMFVWYVHGFPESASKYISAGVKKQLADIVGELAIRLDVWLYVDEPRGRMVIMEEDNFLKKIFTLLEQESCNLSIEITFLDQKLAFSDFDFTDDHVEGEWGKDGCVDLIQYTPQRLSFQNLLQMMSDDLLQDDLRATIQIKFPIQAI